MKPEKENFKDVMHEVYGAPEQKLNAIRENALRGATMSQPLHAKKTGWPTWLPALLTAAVVFLVFWFPQSETNPSFPKVGLHMGAEKSIPDDVNLLRYVGKVGEAAILEIKEGKGTRQAQISKGDKIGKYIVMEIQAGHLILGQDGKAAVTLKLKGGATLVEDPNKKQPEPDSPKIDPYTIKGKVFDYFGKAMSEVEVVAQEMVKNGNSMFGESRDVLTVKTDKEGAYTMNLKVAVSTLTVLREGKEIGYRSGFVSGNVEKYDIQTLDAPGMKPFHVKGRVVDQYGEPVKDAVVRALGYVMTSRVKNKDNADEKGIGGIFPKDGEKKEGGKNPIDDLFGGKGGFQAPEYPVEAEGKTGADGFYDLEIKKIISSVEASVGDLKKNGWLPQLTGKDLELQDIVLMLEDKMKPFTLSGQIFDQFGDPVEGAVVAATTNIDYTGWKMGDPLPKAQVLGSAESGKDGKYALKLTKRTDNVSVEWKGKALTGSYMSHFKDKNDLNFTVSIPERRKVFTIQGRVIDVDGKTVAGVEVKAYGFQPVQPGMPAELVLAKTQSDKNGNFTLEVDQPVRIVSADFGGGRMASNYVTGAKDVEGLELKEYAKPKDDEHPARPRNKGGEAQEGE